MTRGRTYTYDVFHGGQAVKLIVSAAKAARVTAVVGAAVYRAVFFDNVGIEGRLIRIEDNEFGADGLRCNMQLSGVNVAADARIDTSTAFNRPLGLLCDLGLSSYTVEAPAVRATLVGRVKIGNNVFSDGDFAVVTQHRGSLDYRRTTLTAADARTAVYVGFGDNATWGKVWNYAVACVVTNERSYVFSGASKLVEFEDGADAFSVEISSPTMRLKIVVRADHECEDGGNRYTVSGIATVYLTAGGSTRSYRLPATYAHLGAVKTKAEQELPESEKGTVKDYYMDAKNGDN